MEEAAFDRLASDTLKRLEKALTDIDPAIEADLASDILTIEFEDGRKYIVNSHRAARQIWLAAASRAWHFSFDGVTKRWIDTRENHELWTLIGELLSKAVGRAVPVGNGT